MNTASLRELNTTERELLNRLLSEEFPGRGQLVEQLRDCLVRTIDEDGGLEIQVRSSIKAPDVKYRVPTEGEGEDSDGVTIHFLLHVVNGVANELEVYKEDNSQISKWPQPENIRVFAPP